MSFSYNSVNLVLFFYESIYHVSFQDFIENNRRFKNCFPRLGSFGNMFSPPVFFPKSSKIHNNFWFFKTFTTNFGFYVPTESANNFLYNI